MTSFGCGASCGIRRPRPHGSLNVVEFRAIVVDNDESPNLPANQTSSTFA